MDGGGAAVLASTKSVTDGSTNMVTFCANSRMTIFNEHGCRLSTDPNACSPGSFFVDESVLNMTGGTVVCGSEGEVAPRPISGADTYDLSNLQLDTMIK